MTRANENPGLWYKEPDPNCELCQGSGEYPRPNGPDDFDLEICTCTYDDTEAEMIDEKIDDLKDGLRNVE